MCHPRAFSERPYKQINKQVGHITRACPCDVSAILYDFTIFVRFDLEITSKILYYKAVK